MRTGCVRFGMMMMSLALLSGGAAETFPCTPVMPARKVPADVTELHPAHVSVIMAVGDSVTAAFGSRDAIIAGRNNSIEFPLEYRQDSFSGGAGSEEFWTLPFFLRQYAQNLEGYSPFETVAQTPKVGYLEPRVDFMNVALSAARSEHLPRELHQLHAQSRRIPWFNERWKVLTLLIGANDVCHGFRACSGNASDVLSLADEFEKNLEDALTDIERSISRVYVNLISLFSIASVRRATQSHSGILPCHLESKLLDECHCIDQPYQGWFITEDQLQNFDKGIAVVNARIERVAEKFNHRRSDFAVVAHTSWAGQDIPDFTYLSKLDCFHPSSHAHRVMARLLWNSMFSSRRHAKKINESEPVFCPTPWSAFDSGKRKWPNAATAEPQREPETVTVVV